MCCHEKVSTHFTDPNLTEKFADQHQNENVGGIKKPEQWDQIKKTHPHIATKVMDMIVFENQPSNQG